MGLFLGHNIRIFHFFCIPFNFAFIPWHSHPLKQKLTVSPHTQCPLCWNSPSQTVQWPANLCLPKSKGNHVCLLSQLPRTHSNWTWIVLCSSVPLSPKKARECNYIKIYEITRITLYDGRQKLLYSLLFFAETNLLIWRTCTRIKNTYITRTWTWKTKYFLASGPSARCTNRARRIH